MCLAEIIRVAKRRAEHNDSPAEAPKETRTRETEAPTKQSAQRPMTAAGANAMNRSGAKIVMEALVREGVA